MNVPIVPNGDVEISASLGMNCVNVETKLSVMSSTTGIIAAPTYIAIGTTTDGAQTRSYVPEARCWTSLSLVMTADVTPTLTHP